MGECNTILSAYTMYRHLQYYCSHHRYGKEILVSDQLNTLCKIIYKQIVVGWLCWGLW